MNQGSGNFF